MYLDLLPTLTRLPSPTALDKHTAALDRELRRSVISCELSALLLLVKPRLLRSFPSNEALAVLASVHGQVHLKLFLRGLLTQSSVDMLFDVDVFLTKTQYSPGPISNGDSALRGYLLWLWYNDLFGIRSN